MSCYVRQMHKEDIDQVNEIDREAFPTQWPAPNYQSELKNQMAFLTVACDLDRLTEPKPGQPVTTSGEKSRTGPAAFLKWLFGDSSSGNQSKSSDGHYIVGFISCWIMADEAHITGIAVRESYRRRGIGELLIISAVETAMKQGANMLTLEVRVSNTGAQALYTKYGFNKMGVRKAYYTDNREDAIIMSTDKINSASFQARFQQLKEAHSHRPIAIKTNSPQ